MYKKHNSMPLYDDELTVLRLIAAGHPGDKILETMKISNEQLQAIYRKLKGTFRTDSLTEAARIAKEVGII